MASLKFRHYATESDLKGTGTVETALNAFDVGDIVFIDDTQKQYIITNKNNNVVTYKIYYGEAAIVGVTGTGATRTLTFSDGSEITITINDVEHATTSDSCSGNAKSATTLQTARKINGTNFNGSTDITTSKWGTSRNIGIVNSDGTGTAVTVGVNGSNNINLKLPSIIKANLEGNASSATKATADVNGNDIANTYARIDQVYNDSEDFRQFLGKNGSSSDWIKTTTAGILPYTSGDASDGHCSLGTPTWYFSQAYIQNIYGYLNGNISGSSTSCSGNSATATKAGYLDTKGMALYANNSNEINFGGTSTSSIIYFGYRATGNKPIPTSFIFGGFTGTATLTANGFKKRDSDASYVLTGDGGHAAISGLSVNYAASSGSCSGNAASSTQSLLLSNTSDAKAAQGVYFHMDGDATSLVGNTEVNGVWGHPSYSQDARYGNASILRIGWSSAYYTDIFTGPNAAGEKYGLQWRQIVNSTANDWRMILDSSNYNSYAPKLDGTGAAGTWGINISGDAATLGGLPSSRYLMLNTYYYTDNTNADTLTGVSFYINATGNGSGNSNFPTTYGKLFSWGGAYAYTQLYADVLNNGLYFRTKSTAFSGDAWKEIAFTDSNVASATNADMLDGYHESSFTKKLDLYITDLNSIAESLLGQQSTSSRATPELHYPVQEAGGLISILSAYNSTNQIYGTFSSNRWFARGAGSGVSSRTSWREFAFLDSNVASATKLQTPRTIWGQSFDGTGNVNGDITLDGLYNVSWNTTITNTVGYGLLFRFENGINGPFFEQSGYVGIGTTDPLYKLDVNGEVRATAFRFDGDANRYTKYEQSITMFMPSNSGWAGGLDWFTNSGDLILALGYYYDGGYGNDFFYFGYGASYENPVNVMLPNGNIGIGTTSPSYKLDVNGTISCTTLLQTSDIKYKTNIKQIEYEEALKIIENLNPVTWDWNENTVEIGSSSGFVAQEAEEFIPNAISRDNENNLSLDYTQLHSYEIRVIQEQQKEIIKLKEKLKILENLIS